MLEARKNRPFEFVFARYNRHLLRRRFESFRAAGFDVLGASRGPEPKIIYANHSSWWDGLVACEISRAAQLDAFIMMEEKQLKKLFPFRLVGAFSVVRENPREAVRSLEYAVRLLRNVPGRTLWIFPQGEILPNDVRPLVFYRGLARIAARVGECTLIPLAMRYEFLGRDKPAIFLRLGEAESIAAGSAFEIKAKTKAFADRLTAELDRLKTDIISQNYTEYRNLFER